MHKTSPAFGQPSNQSWLKWARRGAFAFILFCLFIFAGGVFFYPEYAAAHPDEFLAWDWSQAEMNTILGRVGLSFQWWVWFNLVSAVLFTILHGSLALLILLKQKNDWLSLYVAVVLALLGALGSYPSDALADAYPPLKLIIQPIGVSTWPALFLLFYLFPDGRFVPRWMIVFAGLLVLSFVLAIMLYGNETPPPWLLLVAFSMIAIGAANQVYRYLRVSNVIQRQQTKWVLFALMVVFTVVFITIVPLSSSEPIPPHSLTALFLMLLAVSTHFILGLIPLSIAVAILRYRLWDIDFIIRRTLVYTALTAVLGLVYLGTVTVMQNLFTAASGQNSPLTVVLSTLVIAALFSPLRHRIQAFIDRRFYRQKYNAEQALAGFAALARSETDLQALSYQLLSVVQETIQPAQVSLWLRDGRDVRKEFYES